MCWCRTALPCPEPGPGMLQDGQAAVSMAFSVPTPETALGAVYPCRSAAPGIQRQKKGLSSVIKVRKGQGVPVLPNL